MKTLIITLLALMLTGCVAYPVYDYGYYPYYGPYPYSYVGPNIHFFYSDFYGGHRFHGGGR